MIMGNLTQPFLPGLQGFNGHLLQTYKLIFEYPCIRKRNVFPFFKEILSTPTYFRKKREQITSKIWWITMQETCLSPSCLILLCIMENSEAWGGGREGHRVTSGPLGKRGCAQYLEEGSASCFVLCKEAL